jgi:hypothetical protein
MVITSPFSTPSTPLMRHKYQTGKKEDVNEYPSFKAKEAPARSLLMTTMIAAWKARKPGYFQKLANEVDDAGKQVEKYNQHPSDGDDATTRPTENRRVAKGKKEKIVKSSSVKKPKPADEEEDSDDGVDENGYVIKPSQCPKPKLGIGN